jgi:hypothetical protein
MAAASNADAAVEQWAELDRVDANETNNRIGGISGREADEVADSFTSSRTRNQNKWK